VNFLGVIQGTNLDGMHQGRKKGRIDKREEGGEGIRRGGRRRKNYILW